MHEAAGPGSYVSRLRYDPRYFLEQKYCNEHGLPHSTFLAWAPEDRAKAIAFEIESAQRCQICGTAPWEWDPAQGGNKHAYEVIEHFCQGCHDREYMQDAAANAPGVRLELAKTGTVESAKRRVKAMRRSAKERS